MICKVGGKQINQETRGWESKPPLWKAILPTWGQKKSPKTPSMAATVREQHTIRERKSRKAVTVRSNRKSFCNCTNRRRKARKLWSATPRGGKI